MTEFSEAPDKGLEELSALVALERELSTALTALDRLKELGYVTIEYHLLLKMTVELINQITAVQTAITTLRSAALMQPAAS